MSNRGVVNGNGIINGASSSSSSAVSSSVSSVSPNGTTSPNDSSHTHSSPAVSSSQASDASVSTSPRSVAAAAAAARRTASKNIRINPWGEGILTILFIITVYWLVTGLWFSEREGPLMVAALAICTLGTAVFILVCRRAFIIGGTWFSRHFLAKAPFHDPLSKEVNLAKFADQGWQVVQHALSSLFAYYLMTRPGEVTGGGAWGWLDNMQDCWTPCPLDKIPTTPERVYYLTQLGIWMYSSISQRFIQEKAKDYLVMLGHHVTTLSLVTGSYLGGNTRIGVVILFVHDFSDISIDLLKIFNYAKLEGRPAFYAVEIAMLNTLVCWFYWRLYVFPFHVLPSTIWDSHDACGDPAHRGDYWHHDPPGIQMWRLANCLMVMLVFMHAYWFALLLRVVKKAVQRENLHHAGAEAYEGHSDDEHDD